VPNDQWSNLLQIIDKSERESREVTAARLGPLAEPVFQVLDQGGRSDKLDSLVRQLELRNLGNFVKVDLSIVRGLAYYTGLVFEVFDRGGKLRAIAGGGRYDNLIAQLSDGTVSLPAVGFAMGDVVLGELIKETPETLSRLTHMVSNQSALDVYLIVAKEDRRDNALKTLQQLRDGGWRVDYSLAPAKVGKQFQTAEAMGARVTLLFGDEWPQVKMKILATREEILVPNEAILERLKAMGA
jgi:histidyl-tRNA synthetase